MENHVNGYYNPTSMSIQIAFGSAALSLHFFTFPPTTVVVDNASLCLYTETRNGYMQQTKIWIDQKIQRELGMGQYFSFLKNTTATTHSVNAAIRLIVW